MIKVFMERVIKGKNVTEIVRLLRQLRVKAMQQPGYISGETLHAVDDPNVHLVISSWENLAACETWYQSPERQQLQAELDRYLEVPTKMRIFTY